LRNGTKHLKIVIDRKLVAGHDTITKRKDAKTLASPGLELANFAVWITTVVDIASVRAAVDD
jgi:hypothetical protein